MESHKLSYAPDATINRTMPVTWFFDGAGFGPNCRTLVLSGVGASDAVWSELNEAWHQGLQQLQIRAWHSTDYFRRLPGADAQPVPIVLLNVIGQTVIKEFGSISFALDKTAAASIRAEYPEIIPSDAKILMNLCFSCISTSEADRRATDSVSIRFDRGEPFIRELKHPWQLARKLARQTRKPGWPLQTREVETANSIDYPGLQMADLLSWTVRCGYEYRENEAEDFKIPMMLFSYLPKLRGGYLDGETLRAIYERNERPHLAHRYSFR